MAGVSALDRLAERCGIVPHYRDIWGVLHPTTDETKRALIEAMGFAAADEAAAGASLLAAERADCQDMLPPVVVLTAGEPAAVPVALLARGAGSLRWRLEAETGDHREGLSRFADLARAGRMEICGSDYERRILTLPRDLPTGYHRLRVEAQARQAETAVIVAPAQCLTLPELVGERRLWGVAAQLYGVRTGREWGMGDFASLAELAEAAAALGAATVGINPVHALFTADPEHFGPYSPSTRLLLNVAYIDVASVPELACSAAARALMSEAGFKRVLKHARRAELVDYGAVARLKLPVLEALFRQFAAEGPEGERHSRFAAWRDDAGSALHRHAVFEALHEHFFGREGIWSWRHWPPAYRRHDSPEVAAFACANGERVAFHEWLQWTADEQLAAAQRRARAAGMPIGIYTDMAVAVHPDGSMAWSYPEVTITGASVGAPPDELGPAGQNWGLAPLSPEGLRRTAYAPFVATLRAVMQHSGAVRIDHAMTLTRLFWIPQGRTGRDGAYVNYPFRDLIRLVALESRRNRCIVVAEDLGTVPEGFREALHDAGVLSYKVMPFERDAGGRLTPADAYPADALVAAATHDLPTVAGFWAGRDIDWREEVGSDLSPEWVAGARAERARQRRELIDALRSAGLAVPEPVETAALVCAVHRFLARSPSRLLMVQLEDLLGEIEQPNLPGTGDEHPNWRRKLPMPLSRLFAQRQVKRLIAAVAEERRAASRPATMP